MGGAPSEAPHCSLESDLCVHLVPPVPESPNPRVPESPNPPDSGAETDQTESNRIKSDRINPNQIRIKSESNPNGIRIESKATDDTTAEGACRDTAARTQGKDATAIESSPSRTDPGIDLIAKQIVDRVD